jgi:hypothetical protein
MKKSNFNLSGMKRIKTVNGFKFINSTKREEVEDQVQAIVTQHRAALINGILGGLPQYVDFKFHIKLDAVQRARLTERLMDLKRNAVSIEDCEPFVEDLLKKEEAIVPSSPFYMEIDRDIQHQLWVR